MKKSKCFLNVEFFFGHKFINFNRSKSFLVGLLKIGKKHLFIHDLQGRQHELHPLCVLDFFIYTAQQRKGYGRRLFDFMLNVCDETFFCLKAFFR